SRVPTTPCAHVLFFFSTNPAATHIYTLSLHDALPISRLAPRWPVRRLPFASCFGPSRGYVHRQRHRPRTGPAFSPGPAGIKCRRSEEHTSELQSRENLVCRLLLEKKKTYTQTLFELTR